MKTISTGTQPKITSITVPSYEKVYHPECGGEIRESDLLELALNWHRFSCETCRAKMFKQKKEK